MKIDIGNGKILGTKRVSPNGQISGFTEFAGRDLLVVLPEGEPSVKLSPNEYVKELQIAANEHMKLAFQNYKDLKRKFETPEKATREFMEKHAPKSFQGLYEKIDGFAKEQMGKAEARVERALNKRGNGTDASHDETPVEAPGPVN